MDMLEKELGRRKSLEIETKVSWMTVTSPAGRESLETLVGAEQMCVRND